MGYVSDTARVELATCSIQITVFKKILSFSRQIRRGWVGIRSSQQLPDFNAPTLF